LAQVTSSLRLFGMPAEMASKYLRVVGASSVSAIFAAASLNPASSIVRVDQ
jgi:hypothetical protein